MVEDRRALIDNMNVALRDLRRASPDVMKTFSERQPLRITATPLPARPRS